MVLLIYGVRLPPLCQKPHINLLGRVTDQVFSESEEWDIDTVSETIASEYERATNLSINKEKQNLPIEEKRTIDVKEIREWLNFIITISILIIGQNVVSYNVQNELRLVKKGFPLRYSLKEKLQCKSVIGMFLLLLPMHCYWIAYKFELFSILLWIWMPIQSIIIYTAKNRLQRLLYILPFYILSLLSMRVW